MASRSLLPYVTVRTHIFFYLNKLTARSGAGSKIFNAMEQSPS